MKAGTSLEVRPYQDEDEQEVLELLRASLGPGPAGERSAAFFRWKHLENPFGRSYMLVAEAEGRIVGLRAFLRWRFDLGGREVRAVRAVDTATHPDHQGRGIFRRLTLEALEALLPEADLVFNTPNEKSLSGYLKMGWRVVGRVPIRVRARRPIRLVRLIRSIGAADGAGVPPAAVEAPPAAEALGRTRRWDGLGMPVPRPGDVLVTPRTPRYLAWRYADAPLLGYRAVRIGPGEAPEGLAIFRVRRRGRLVEATIAEVLVRPGDRSTAARLLGRAARAAGVDHATCSFPPGSEAARAARRRGFVPVPAGPTLVARPIRDELAEVVQDPRRWGLSLGDVEVF